MARRRTRGGGGCRVALSSGSSDLPRGRVRVMKFCVAPAAAPPRTTHLTLSQQPPAFSILDRSGGDFEIVGPRTALRRGGEQRK